LDIEGLLKVTSPSVKVQLDELSKQTTANCDGRGVAIITAGESASKLLMLWLHYLRAYHSTGTADCLIDGTASAVREAIACIVLGLVRSAINSLRLQIDLSLAWLYFKDHSVEWRRVQDTGEGFKLKTELLKYYSEAFPRYATRFGLLRDCKTRTLDDPYRLLSAHIHGQSELVLPRVQNLQDIVATTQAQDEALQLQGECSEYINDVFWSVFTDRWANVPAELKTTLEGRFKSPAQRVDFFS
jgi:hypothetical protein